MMYDAIQNATKSRYMKTLWTIPELCMYEAEIPYGNPPWYAKGFRLQYQCSKISPKNFQKTATKFIFPSFVMQWLMQLSVWILSWRVSKNIFASPASCRRMYIRDVCYTYHKCVKSYTLYNQKPHLLKIILNHVVCIRKYAVLLQNSMQKFCLVIGTFLLSKLRYKHSETYWFLVLDINIEYV